jgi:hypothetical protein
MSEHTKAEHEACREIERILTELQREQDCKVTRIGISQQSDKNSVLVWMDTEKINGRDNETKAE